MSRLDAAYNVCIHWKRNCFKLPLGRYGKAFVSEIARLYGAFASSSALESVALKAATVFPILVVQKPHKRSKAKEHTACLERRLNLWNEGELDDLIVEGRAIQSRLMDSPLPRAETPDKQARCFANFMNNGKCKAALDLISKEAKGGLLHMGDKLPKDDQTVREGLLGKHPVGQALFRECTDQSPPPPLPTHPVIFEAIDAHLIRQTALNTTGSAGPSGLDARDWRRLCTSFKEISGELCYQLAMVAQRLCSKFVDPCLTAPFLASRLIAPDKNPGIRPIGIGDTARRIISKAVLSVVRSDIQDVCGCLQLCAGQISGIEAAVHAARSSFELEDNDAILLVDATNAFNSLNRQVALHNIKATCPALATILINNYRAPTKLHMEGDYILSQEGTTQGDPLAMPMYALASIPLIKQLGGNVTQQWYADDAAAVGKLSKLHTWWNDLVRLGPKFGYFPNAAKSWLVTKEGTYNLGCEMFGAEGVQVTDEGRPYLGAAIGTRSYVENYVRSKVTLWSSQLTNLANLAGTQPHAVYSAIIHGFTSKWTYLCRTIPDIAELMKPLDHIIRTQLIPALTGRSPPNDHEATLFSMPVRNGGLGIRIPSTVSEIEFQSSNLVTSPLCAHIVSQDPSYGPNIVESQIRTKTEVRRSNRVRVDNHLHGLLNTLPEVLQRAVKLAQEKGSSTWLTALPLTEHGFTLHKSAFQDAMALRYGWTPNDLPTRCHCSSKFSVDTPYHAPRGVFQLYGIMKSETSQPPS